MSKQDKTPRSGFVIKLSSETVHMLNIKKEQVKEHTETHSSPKATGNDENIPLANTDENVAQSVDANIISISDDKKDTETLKEQTKSSRSVVESKRVDTEGSHSSWGDYTPYITYENEEAIYTDPSTQQKYIWNKNDNSWIPKNDSKEVPGRQYSYEDDTHVYTEADGSKFFWDEAKKAWLPKIDDDFLAFYQMSYGFVDNSSEGDKDKNMPDKKQAQKKDTQNIDLTTGLKRKNEPQWFQPAEETNTKVYVSNLPLDITEEEFVDLMQKCGLVERDVSTQKMKVKLYMDKEHNCFKGDALCTYIKIESVDLALKLLDGSDYKGNTIKVEKAHFQLKGEYNPALKPKKKKKKELEKIKKMQQKLFDWRPEKFIGERSKHERIVIVKNLFHPTDFDKEVQLILDYQQDLREECSKCGEVRKVVIYDRHPEGVAQITMKEPEMADAVIQLINGRWFGKRQITAEIWDGRTKYRIAETDADISKRIDKWDKFLEQSETDKAAEIDTPRKEETDKTVDDKMDTVTVEIENKTKL